MKGIVKMSTDQQELNRLQKLHQQVQRYHKSLENSPALCLFIGGVVLFFSGVATIVDISTTEYLALGTADKIVGLQWGVLTQPWLLVSSQLTMSQSVAYIYAWIVESTQLVLGLAMGHALGKLNALNPRLARIFMVVAPILVLLNGVATYNAAPSANPLMSVLIAVGIGGFAIVGLPIGLGLIETGIEALL